MSRDFFLCALKPYRFNAEHSATGISSPAVKSPFVDAYVNGTGVRPGELSPDPRLGDLSVMFVRLGGDTFA
jgi:hypothetical protein